MATPAVATTRRVKDELLGRVIAGRYRLEDVPKAWGTGDFDLFPAGGGQVAALIKEVKPVKAIIEEMVS